VSAIVLEAIALEIAGLVRVVPVPTGAPGYGSDLSCADDLDANLTELPGDSTLLLAQSTFHRLTTNRGDLPDDADYGWNVVALLSKGLTQDGIRAAQSQIAAEVTKDDRISECTATIEQLSLKELRITVACVVEATGEAFELVIVVDSEGAWLEAVT
jgi:hypothetical protein